MKGILAPPFARGGTFAFDGYPHPATVHVMGALGETLDATISVTYLPGGGAPVNVGRYLVSAAFVGSLDYEPAVDTSEMIVIVPATTATYSSAQAASVFGEPLTVLLAVQTAGSVSAPTGTVAVFLDGQLAGTSALQPVTGSSSTGQFIFGALPVGSHTVGAVYGGSPNFAASIAPILTLATSRASTAVVLAASPEPSGSGEPVILTARVTPVAPGDGAPSGNVTFTDNGIALGAAPLALQDGSYVAILTVGTPAAGTHALAAEYGGDAHFLGAQVTASHLVNPAKASTSTILQLPSSAAVGTLVTLDAAVGVASGNMDPTGDVEFIDGDISLGIVPLQPVKSAMHGIMSLAFAASGQHQIVARYLPNGALSTSTSLPASLLVYDSAAGAPVGTLVSVAVANRASAGAPVAVNIAVDAATPPKKALVTGAADVYVDGRLFSHVSVVDSSGTATLTDLSIGDHQIVAVFISGTPGYSGSTSRAQSIAIR